jgi:hypothetical protein
VLDLAPTVAEARRRGLPVDLAGDLGERLSALLGAGTIGGDSTPYTGILSVAVASLGRDWFHEGWFARGVVGIAVMFVLNLSVSFLLSLFSAARAYGIPRREVSAILRQLYRHAVASPRDFILPPRRTRANNRQHD